VNPILEGGTFTGRGEVRVLSIKKLNFQRPYFALIRRIQEEGRRII